MTGCRVHAPATCHCIRSRVEADTSVQREIIRELVSVAWARRPNMRRVYAAIARIHDEGGSGTKMTAWQAIRMLHREVAEGPL